LRDGKRWSFWLIDPAGTLRAHLDYRDEAEALRAHALFRELSGALPEPTTALQPTAAPSSLEPEDAASRQSERESFRQWVHTLLEEGQSDSVWGRIIEAALIVLIVANVAAVALESIPSIGARFHGLFFTFEEISLGIYTLEYIVRVWSATEDPRIASRGPLRGRITFALRPMMLIDFLAFAPSYLGLFFGIDLRVLRIFRLFRLLKLARYSQALQALLGVLLAERSALLASTILLLGTMCLFGELMHLVEGKVQPNTLGTMPGAMYWALTTLTTVGYGDIAPQTPLGKFLACVTMVTGLALFALPVGIIANGFVTGLSRRRFAITWNMLRRQPLFHGLDMDTLHTILEVPTASIVREHAHVTVAGREAGEFYLVVAGQARIEHDDQPVKLEPGDMIGIEALDHASTYRETVTAETDLRVMAFPADELRRLCRKYPILRARMDEARAGFDAGGHEPGPEQRIRDLEAENARLREALCNGILDRLMP
jgi:voltage-gated potassium channel